MVAVISGGARGIGKGIALSLASKGIDIAFCYNSSHDCAEATLRELREYGVRVNNYRCDIGNYKQCERFINDVINDFERIDVLVNNAGVINDAPLVLMSEEQFDDVMNTNIKGTFNLTKFCIKHMMHQRGGSIVNISSISGIIGIAGQANYSASKAAMIGFTNAISKEYGRYGIRCNVIAPGFIGTEMTEGLPEKRKKEIIRSTPLKKVGRIEDVANLVCFLVSDQGSFITGEVIRIDGGLAIGF